MVCNISEHKGNVISESQESHFFSEKTTQMVLCEIESSIARTQETLNNVPIDFLGLFQVSPVIVDTRILKGTIFDTLEYYENPPTIGFVGIEEIGKDGWKDNFFTTDANNSEANGVFIGEPKGFLSVAHSMHPRLNKIAEIEDDFNPNFTSHGGIDTTFIRLDNDFIPLTEAARSNLSVSTSKGNIMPEGFEIGGKLIQVIGYDEGGRYSQDYEGLKVLSGVALHITADMVEYVKNTMGEEQIENFPNHYMFKVASFNTIKEANNMSGSPVYSEGKLVGILRSWIKIGGNYFIVFTGIDDIRREVISITIK